jgi:hypothetical protein
MPADNSKSENWSAEDKLAVVIETAALNEAQLSEYYRSKGLYIEQIEQGKNLSSPWHELKNQIYIGDETFVEQLQKHLEADRDLSEVPKGEEAQCTKRQKSKT